MGADIATDMVAELGRTLQAKLLEFKTWFQALEPHQIEKHYNLTAEQDQQIKKNEDQLALLHQRTENEGTLATQFGLELLKGFQSAIPAAAPASSRPGETTPFKIDISNHKAIQSLKSFDNEREKFVEWNDKLINALARIIPGSRELLKHFNKIWAQHENK